MRAALIKACETPGFSGYVDVEWDGGSERIHIMVGKESLRIPQITSEKD